MDKFLEFEISHEEYSAIELAGETLTEVIEIPYSNSKRELTTNFKMMKYEKNGLISFIMAIYIFQSLDIKTLAISMDYIERLYEIANIGPKNIHMVVCISILLAKKHLEDFPKMLSFSEMLNIKKKVICRAETEFLECIDYGITVKEETFNQYMSGLSL